jgi:hypothetical protein
MSPDMPWSHAAALLLAACLVGGGTIAVIVSLYRDEQRRKLGHFDARVGRDCWKDIKGLTR